MICCPNGFSGIRSVLLAGAILPRSFLLFNFKQDAGIDQMARNLRKIVRKVIALGNPLADIIQTKLTK